jgi:hypothetical protein
MDDDWADTFLDNEARVAEDSDSDSEDPTYTPGMQDGYDDVEEEVDVGPTIQRQHTQHLRDCMTGTMVEKVRCIFELMDGLGINLTLFLDAVSWGDSECTADAKIRYERSGLMKSEELPQILHRWWRPPRSSASHKRRPSAASDVMERFASDCFTEVVDHELGIVGSIFRSPSGEDIKEETLTGFVFEEVVPSVQQLAPNFWSVLHGLAYTKSHRGKNSRKKPEKVMSSSSSI